ncbi:MAG TPA: aromatic acid exporter family protein [Clostridia bacterium]|nr:aromatic acid exporter family protein [Clostridia bacterium]
MKIGMRTVKTGIAISICIFISRLLNFQSPFYSAIAAIITMENTFSNSWQAGKNRMLGTVLGAVIGLVFALIQPGSILLSGLGTITVIFLSNLLGWEKATSIACVVFLAIMTNLGGKSPFLYSLNRIRDTFIGIIIAIIVNYLIFPPDYQQKFYTDLQSFLERLEQLRATNLNLLDKTEFSALKQDLEELKKQFMILKSEFGFRKSKPEELDQFQDILDLSKQILNKMELIYLLKESSLCN